MNRLTRTAEFWFFPGFTASRGKVYLRCSES
jgi:hypothetical protein